MDLLRRKVIELKQKLASLTDEFGYWLEISEVRPHGELPTALIKHHTQIRRVISTLDGFAGRIDQSLNQADAAVLDNWRRLENDILEIHRVWDFFRSKFALRAVDWFRDYLAAADDFASACYERAQRCIPEGSPMEARLKEPPLVFFNGESSPFIMSRNDAYQVDGDTREKLRSAELISFVRKLPLPVVGIPWFQVRHFPDALIIAHEVGHCVEDDFGLTTPIVESLDREMRNAEVAPERQGAWKAWAGEVFADLYGALAVGPAFGGALIDFLAVGKVEITSQRFDSPYWGSYPTDYLRVLLVLEALRVIRFEQESVMIRQKWLADYPKHAMKEFETDVPIVVAALIDRRFDALNAKLQEVISFTTEQQKRAVEDAAKAINNRALEGAEPLELTAAARLAFERDPDAYLNWKATERFLARLAKTRSSRPRAAKRSQSKATLKEILKRDRKTGEQIFEESRLSPNSRA